VVTGGARGIGLAIATAFLAEGAALAVWDTQTSPESATRLATRFGDKYLYLRGDVSEETDVARCAAATVDRFTQVDVLVNNAGIVTQGVMESLTVEEWDRIIAVNLRSVFLCCRAVLPDMKSRRSGRIINVASQIGQIGGAEMAHYCAAKAGVIGFTKALAREVAPTKVLVNAIAPGLIETDMTKAVSPEWRDAKLATLPIGRYGRPGEVAAVAVFLASDDSSYFVGQTLGPNGGDVML